MTEMQFAPPQTNRAGAQAPPLTWACTALDGRALGRFRAEWDGLLSRLWQAHPLLDGCFIDAVLRHFGTGREQLCIGTRRDGGVAAMCLLQPRSLGRWQSFLPAQAQVGPTLARSAADFRGLLAALPGLALQVDLLCNDPSFGNLCEHGVTCKDHARTTRIELDGHFDAYWAGRPNKLRQNMRRYARKLSEHGPVRLVEIASPQEIEDAVHRYALIEAAGWKGAEGTAIRPGSAQESFYRELLLEQATPGDARAYELWAGDHHVASRLAVARANMVVMLKTTYDERFAAGAPGHVLLQQTIERLFSTDPGKCIEFYTNASHEQEAWSTSQRQIRHATLYSSSAARTVARCINSLRSTRD